MKTPTLDPKGYYRVRFARDGKMINASVHRVVLEAFVGPCPEGHEACHNNGNPSDNRLENLRWDTKSANALDRVRDGRDVHARLTHCPNEHEYTPENTDRRPDGSRRCRACHRARERARYARRVGKH